MGTVGRANRTLVRGVRLVRGAWAAVALLLGGCLSAPDRVTRDGGLEPDASLIEARVWQLQDPISPPLPLYAPRMAFDPKALGGAGATLLYGGSLTTSFEEAQATLWMFDGEA